jgi:AcrR family transcriptional regulator
LNVSQVESAPRRAYNLAARADGMNATRERIVQSMLRLALEHAYEDITLAAIAEAAGVSHQTVLNHFESKEKVGAAAAEVLSRQTETIRDQARAGDHAGAVGILVGEYERFGDAAARWAATSERLGSLAPLLDGARVKHQAWLERIFAGRLPRAPESRRRAIHALHAATDVYTWKLLRRDLRLSRAETERIMLDLANGVLARKSPRSAPHSRRRR